MADPASSPIKSKKIQSALGLDDLIYRKACQELSDRGLLRDAYHVQQNPFAGVTLTPSGRNTVRDDFQQRSVLSFEQNNGAVFHGPVTDSTIQSIGVHQMKRIFISHASKDNEIVQAFIDELLVGALAVKVTDIFCTTTDGTKIKSGEDWRNEIKEHLVKAKITFLFITPNYKESEICLNEMGAAWVLSGRTIPLFVEPINYDSVGLLQEVKQVEKLQDEKSLDRIKDILQEDLEIPAIEIRSDRWTAKKKEFLEKLNKHLKSNPFGIPVTKEQVEHLNDEVENLSKENESLNIKIEKLSGDNIKLEKLNTDLKNALTPKEFAAIERRYLDFEKMDEFDFLCNKVKEPLSKLKGVVPAIVFVNYSGKQVGISFEGWESILQDAIARDILVKDNLLEPNWRDTKTMRKIRSSLDALRKFIDENKENQEFIFAYESKFESPLNLSNLGFWEEIFGLPILFE